MRGFIVDFDDLPNSWAVANLEDCTEVIMGQSPPSSTYNDDAQGLPFFQGKAEFGELYPTPRKWCTEPKKIAEKGDVLISVRAPVGPTNICQEKSCIGRGLAAIRGLGQIESKFIIYCLRILENVIASQGAGTTFDSLPGEKLRKIKIPLPPLNEQKRIVEKIELIQEHTRKVKSELDNIKVKLKRFRRSLLASAFRGDLTKDWRADHPDIESANVLLERIKKERREKWEQAELEKMRVKGITPKDDKWKSKYSEPQSVKNIDDLPTIPDEWCWVTLDTIMTKIVDGTHHTPDYTNQGIAFLSVKDIKNNEISFDECKYISPDTHKELSKRCCPKLGDLLITKSGTIGRCAVVKTDRPFNLFVSVALLQPFNNTIDSNFVSLSFQSWFQTIDVQNNITGSTIKNFHLIDFKKLAIKFAPLEEQKEIVRKLEKMMQFADRVEEQVKEAEKKLEKFNQSVLAKAFRGKLVPQDPNDEPASVLLGKIQQEKNSTTSKKIKK